VQSKNFSEGSGGRLRLPSGPCKGTNVSNNYRRKFLLLNHSFFYYHVSYRKHASVDRTLQEVNIYEQRKYEVQHLIKKELSWFLKPATCSYKFSFIYTFRLGYYHFIFRKLANHQCLLWWILNICFLKSFAD
jgi:hypothetical protein